MPSLFRRYAPGIGHGESTSQTNGKRGLGKCREILVSQRSSGGLVTPQFRYSPFTAADEKIPLSMVRVNNKPQYLVFCSHSRHLLSKHGHLACGKLKRPCRTRVRRSGMPQNQCQTRLWPLRPLSYPKPSPVPSPIQGAETVQMAARLCEMWRFGPFLSFVQGCRFVFGLLG